MALKVAIQMDPIGPINIDADSTFRIALEAQARGHTLFYYTPDRLFYREGRVFAVDGHHLFNRPGPRLVESAEVLACLIHTPDAVPERLQPFIQKL